MPFKKVVLPGRVQCGGTEEEIVVAHGCSQRKKLICGLEEEIIVARGRLLSPLPLPNLIIYQLLKIRKINLNLYIYQESSLFNH